MEKTQQQFINEIIQAKLNASAYFIIGGTLTDCYAKDGIEGYFEYDPEKNESNTFLVISLSFTKEHLKRCVLT